MHYILDKLISALRYRYIYSKLHRDYIHKLKHEFRYMLDYKSVEEYVKNRYINVTKQDSDTIITK